MSKAKRPPMQPAELDLDGVLRFRENQLVRYLVEWASGRGCSLNDLAKVPARRADRDQFTQLLGYSVSGAPLVTRRAQRKRDKIQERFERSR